MQLANTNTIHQIPYREIFKLLAKIARQHGFDREWLHARLQAGGENALEIAGRFGERAMNEVQRFLHSATDKQGQLRGAETSGQNALRNSRREDKVTQRNSLRREQAPEIEDTNMEHHEDHNMGGAPEEGGEQQIDPIKHVWKRFPNTETAALKWVATLYANNASAPPKTPFDLAGETTATSLLTTGGGAWSNAAGNGTANQSTGIDYAIPRLYQLRMTSPYNIMKSFDALGANVGNSQPNWLEMFDSKYQYYHVLETEWEITMNFGVPYTSGPTTYPNYQDYGLYVFWKYTNEDEPPVGYTVTATDMIANAGNVTNTLGIENIQVTNVAAGGGTYNLTPDDYFRMGGWHHKKVTFNTTHDTTITLSGKYKYGQCKMDIKTLSTSDAHSNATTAEGWNQSGATAAFPENLSVIIVQDNAKYAGTNVLTPTGFRFETEQLIQFKDLRAAYKFPTPQLCGNLPTGISTDAVFFWRGAAYT